MFLNLNLAKHFPLKFISKTTAFAIAFILFFSANQAKSASLFFQLDTLKTGLINPWGMDQFPDSSFIISEKSKGLFLFKKNSVLKIKNLPAFYVRGQGGFLDVRVHPDYPQKPWIYFTFASPSKSKSKKGITALMRAELKGLKLINKKYFFKGEQFTGKGVHFGSRIAFDSSNNVYFSLGDRGKRENAQDLNREAGKIYRYTENGVPLPSKELKNKSKLPAIYSYGHRNPQGLAFHPVTKELWSHEHGPRGGDEINIILSGANYGWPKATFGKEYYGPKISDHSSLPGMQDPIYHWTPSIAPCGMAFLSGPHYKGLENNLLIGSLKFAYIAQLKLKGQKVLQENKILNDIGRVRNVIMGRDGFVYIGIEGPGHILRLRLKQ